MEAVEIYAGIDVGKSFHWVFATDACGNKILSRQVDQCEADLKAVLSELAQMGSTLVVVDQPNNIGALTIRCARRVGCSVAFLPSKKMRRAAEMFGAQAKTDRIDAEVIAQSARQLPELLNPIPDENKEKGALKVLRSRDKDLSYDETRAKNRLRAALLESMPAFEAILAENRLDCKFTLAALKRFGGPWGMKAHLRAFENFCKKFKGKVPAGLVADMLNAVESQEERPECYEVLEAISIAGNVDDLLRIKEQRAQISKEIAQLLKDDESYALLRSIPGIGEKIASTILAEVDIDDFESSSRLASYAGVAPNSRRSGTSIHQIRKNNGGNRRLKDALFQAARCSALNCTTSALYLKKKKDEGYGYAAAHIALARRLCKVIYGVLKTRTPYYESRLNYSKIC